MPVPTSTPDMWPEALTHLREAHRRGGRVNYVGGPADSITDGFGATSRANGWWSRFARQMSEALGQPTRAIGSAEIATTGSTWPVWRSTGPPVDATGRSLGRHGASLRPGTVISTTQPCDRVRLLYDEITESYGFSGGTLEVRIDGEVAAVLDCGRSEVAGREWDSGPLGAFAPRRVELECVDGDFASVGHSYFHDGDGGAGVLFWRNAHAGYGADAGHLGFCQEESTWTGALTSRVIGRNPFNDRLVRGGAAIAPDCFLCCTGTNDIGRFAEDRGSIASLYEDLIAYIRGRCGDECSIGLIVPTTTNRTDLDHQALFEGTRDACEASGAFLIDLWHPLGSHGDDRSGFYFDGIHPNDRGHAAWADHVSRWMLEAVHASPSASSGG